MDFEWSRKEIKRRKSMARKILYKQIEFNFYLLCFIIPFLSTHDSDMNYIVDHQTHENPQLV